MKLGVSQVTALWLAAGVLFSCAEPPRSRLTPVSLPSELEELDSPIRLLFQQRYRVLDRLLTDPQASDQQLSQAFGNLGMVFHAYRYYDVAERCYRNASTLDSGEFRWRYYLGRSMRAQGRLEESQELLKDALELQPDNVPTHVWLAINATELDHEAQAEGYFHKALERDPSCVRAMVGLGRLAYERGDYSTALTHLESAYSRQPRAASIRYALGMAYREVGDLARARVHLAGVPEENLIQNSISLNDPLIDAVVELKIGSRTHDRRAIRAASQGNHGLAVAEFRQSLAADPDRVYARYGLASSLLELGRREAAIGELDELLRSAPTHAPSNILLAKIHAGDRRFDLAEKHLLVALEVDPRSAEARFELAEVFRNSGRLEAALENYTKASELAPEMAAPRFWATILLSWDGRHEEARRALNKHLVELPSSDVLMTLGSRLLSVAPQQSLRDGERALELGQRAFDSKPTVAAAGGLAMALAELGRFEDAVDWQQRVAAVPGLREAEVQLAQKRISLYEQGAPAEVAWDHNERLEANHLVLPPRPGQPRPVARSEKMAQRLAGIARDSRPTQNRFMNRERLAQLRGIEPPTDPAELAQFEARFAIELLRAGHSAAAVERFERVIQLAKDQPAGLSADFQRQVRSLMAAANMRLGEQENCLERHNAEACILPISGAGVHEIQRGARGALEQLALLLREYPDDLESRWLYNLAAMTLGQYPDGVPSEWLIHPETFESEVDPGRFVDVAPAVGLATSGLAGGVVVDDLDGDGYLDVMVSSWGLTDPLRFFHNRRDGSFEERTREAGLAGLVGGLNLLHADYDNDGDLDVFVLRGAWLGPAGRHPNSLLRNRGDGFFEDVTEEAGLLDFRPTQTAAWGDFDNDGWLDLFVGNESQRGDPHRSQLFRNNGSGPTGAESEVTFTDIARRAGVDTGGDVKGVVWGDIDNDGWLDLYLSRLLEPNLLFHNQGGRGNASFVEIAETAGVTEPENSFPTWFFDYDNDGWLDLFASGYPREYLTARATPVIADALGLPTSAEVPRLYRNRGLASDGAISFSDITAASGLDRVLLAMGANFGDIDNDGWLDFYLGTGAPDFRVLIPNRMFRNDAGRSFQDVTTSGGFGHLQKGHGVAFADFDNDGDQDIFMVVGGAFAGDIYPNVLFANPGNGNRWITLRLEGSRSNRSAIGARVRLELETPSGRRDIHATVGTGGSFGSASLQQEIGLGGAIAILAVEVQWPGGDHQIFTELPLDQIVHLREDDHSARVVDLERVGLSESSVHSSSLSIVN